MKTLLLLLVIIIILFVGYTFIKKRQNKCPTEQTPQALANAAQITQQTLAFLNESNASVVLLARIGSNLAPYSIRFTHFAFALKKQPENEWIMIHLINPCGTSISEIRHQSLQEFFLDYLFAFDALVVIPKPELQASLHKILQSPLILKLHNPVYNMMTYPTSEKYQNSNSWILEVLIAALSNHDNIEIVKNRQDAHQSPLMKQYQSDIVYLPMKTCFSARLFEKNIHLLDHPVMDQIKGTFNVVTVRSVLRLLQTLDQVQSSTIIELSGKQENCPIIQTGTIL